MDTMKAAQYRIGRAGELEGADRRLYRFFEMIPGILSWGTVIGAIVASYWVPFWAALFIIAFDIYWFVKTIFLSIHLRKNWHRTRVAMSTDWGALVATLPKNDLYHMIVLPFYKEDYNVISRSLDAIISARTDHSKILIVLAGEERAGISAQDKAERAREEYAHHFGYFFVSTHPAGLGGEIPGKGSNISYACERVRVEILDSHHIPYAKVVVSAFDIDTIVLPEYFNCLSWHVLTHPDPVHASFQPVPLYNNNIWDAPALSRVVAFSGTFWQMIQQERPERLATFSSHAVLFETLVQVGYWQKNMVSEDSRIFWNCYMYFNGKYEVVPIAYPVSMDANLASTRWQTIKNIYLQQRRWSWGVENVPYILFNFIKRPDIPLARKMRMSWMQLEGFWSLATNPLLIFFLGWLPTIIGRGEFPSLILAYNLPIITRDIMIVTMFGLVISAYLALALLPPIPSHIPRRHRVYMVLQWAFVPVTIVIFGAIPALDAQARLFLGRYLGFWVTPKHRSLR